jgi:hypothetical protein
MTERALHNRLRPFQTRFVGADPRVRPRADTWVGPYSQG